MILNLTLNLKLKYTIKTVIDELEKNPDRIFNQVEIAFFWRWWRESSDQDRSRLTTLVQNGQFHFLNAGWCMHDEAIGKQTFFLFLNPF